MEKTMILGECKWGRHPADQDVLEKLAARVAECVPKDGRWRVLLLGFARSGWTEAARRFAPNLAGQALPGLTQLVGVELLDLKRIDDDLAEWA